ncbi:DUF1330 domain-containing protein [Photobacterium sanctipauli]|uniref:DUF1330 domain-containing protein n=1 Tax=Photobacterium sanctipauli TaxID=1342794 RepID=A0A2T3NWC0_9GAMM|nr:DUF1330 domain-containing protein [Photobacterium sanctipauli]PSW20546.1 DUF1330 domain-containing protein [Photobacterium sanctipauli]
MKGYWLAHVTVHDTEQYLKYTALAPQAFAAYGGKLLARGGRYQQLEGDERQRHVVIEFPSFDDALACYHSEAYQQAAAERQGVAAAEVAIVEGV